MPVSAATITIDNTTPGGIAQAVVDAGEDGTVILQPGTYFEHGIVLANSVTIKANTPADGSAENTIIDAGMSGRIIGTGSHSLTIEELTLRNGRETDGGAIYSISGDINITSSVFKNCSAVNGGGAIYIESGTITVTSSTFTGCSAENGGAFHIMDGTNTITSSTFTDCSSDNYGGAIYFFSGTTTVTSSTFTNCSAKVGGAISNDRGTLNVISSTFTECSAENGGLTDGGGAIYIYRGNIDVTLSDFTDCSAYRFGGAIFTYCDDLTIVTSNTVTSSTFTGCSANNGGAITFYSDTNTVTSSTFTDCSAVNGGGAIFIDHGTTDVTSSTFEDCSANQGGAIFIYAGTTTITSSIFTGCSANQGGAIYSLIDSSTTNIISSTFTNCSAPAGSSEPRGGAIYIYAGTTTVTSSTFTGCSATNGKGGTIYIDSGTTTVTSSDFTNSSTNVGGAIFIGGGTTDVISSTFTVCEAFSGGAIYIESTTTVTSSTFTGCEGFDGGGAIYIGNSGSGSMHFSRIYNCNIIGKAVGSNGVVDSFDATNNWWGTNANPSEFIEETTAGSVKYNPWLFLGASANPATVNAGGNSIIRADLTYDSNGEDTSGNGHVPDGIQVLFAVTSGPGSMAPAADTTVSGLAESTFSSATTGTATVNITVDDQVVTQNIAITANGGGGAGGGGGGGSNTNTGVGASQDLKAGDSTVFTFEGKGSVDGLLVTVGDDTVKLMVTVRKQDNPPSSVDAPDTEVYEYEDVTIYYTEPSAISGGTFEFKVDKSWISSNGFEIGDIVMLHYNEETSEWEELSTTFVREEGGYYYYSSETPSFSWFAIAYSEGATIVPEEATVVATTVATPVSSTTPVPDETEPVTVPQDDNSSWASMVVPGLGLFLVGIIAVGIAIRIRKEKYPDWWNKEFK